MARITTYALDNAINDNDKLIGTDAEQNDRTKNFSLVGIADYVIDKFIDPDATDFHIPVFNQNGLRITDSIMHQDSSVSNGVAGTKITIAGDLTLERDQSDTTLTLISDGSDTGDQHNPSIKFIQDGGAQNAAVGFNIIDDTGGGTIPGTGNRFWIVNAMDDNTGEGGITFGTAQVDGWDNAIGRFIIRGDGKGLFGHPDSLYSKTLGSQFEIYDNRDENTTTDPSFSVYSVVDIGSTSGNEGAGGIKQILDVYDNGVFQQQEAMMLIPGTNSSDFAASTPLAFYTNSDMDTASPSGFAGIIFDSGNWLLDGSGTFTTTDPGYQLKVAGNTNITGDAQIDTLTNNYIPVNNAQGVLRDSGFYQVSASSLVDKAIGLNTVTLDSTYGEYPDLRVASRSLNDPGVLDLFRPDGEVQAGDRVGILQYSLDDDNQYTVAQIEVKTIGDSGTGNTGGGKLCIKTSSNATGAQPTERICIDNTGADFSVPVNVTNANQSSFVGQVTIPETPVAGTDAASKAYVDDLVSGGLTFKGTFRADTGEIISGANAGASLYQCPGGARVSVLTGDYYIVANTGGQFYCSGDLLNIGDSIIAVADAAADSSTVNDWSTLESDNIEGTGLANTVPLWTDSQVLGNSALSQEAGTAYNTSQNLVVRGNIYQSNMGQSVSIGKGALENGSSAVFSAENVAIGQNALNSLTTATNNIGIGANTLQNTNSNNNIAIGKNSQISQSTGLGNISLGFNSLSGTNVNDSNIVIGHTAVQNTVAGSGITGNVILGAGAVNATTITQTLSNNVVIGINALEEADASSISRAVFVGRNAGKFIEANADKDIGIGFSAFYGNNNGFNSAGENVAIGANANGANTQTGIRRSIKIGSDAGTAGSYAVNISAVNANNYGVNSVLGEHAAIIGGANNGIQGADAAFTGGGRDNTIGSGAIGGAILGGYNNTVSSGGSAGMALGSNLAVDGENQVVVGRYNTGNNNSKLIVGAGFSNANRINAFEVKNTSQLKLGKYGGTQFLQTGSLYNLLTVSTTGNVNEVPVASLNPQNLEASNYTVNPGGTVNLPGDSSTRLVKISWGSANNGTMILRLPATSAFSNKTIQIITDGTFDVGGGKKITIEGSFGTGDTIDGVASFELSKKYEGVTLWSDGTEWFVIQSKAH